LVAFFLSPEAEETRAQLAAALHADGDGQKRLNVERALELLSMASRLHPDFRASALISALGSYLFSAEGRPVRSQIFAMGTQWALAGITGALNRLTRVISTPPPEPQFPERARGAVSAEPVQP
jgi:hypothetical protein